MLIFSRSGRNLTITAHGTFARNIPSNATTYFLVEADHGGLVGFGEVPLCESVKIYQTVGKLTEPVCPPVRGYAMLNTEVLIDTYWPALSSVACLSVESEDTNSGGGTLVCAL